MSAAPIPVRKLPSGRAQPERNTTTGRPRQAPSPLDIARRRRLIVWTKRLLPLFALALLGSIAVWPEIARQTAAEQALLRRLGAGIDASGRLVDATYRGIDQKGRPYTVTAATADQVSPERVNLTEPKADLTLQNGTWLMLQSTDGVYIQHVGLLDLWGNVTLYRDDGTVMRSQTASMDLKSGAGAGNDPVFAEGPFGTLDANGFAFVDKGSVIQFTGPARLVLNNTKP